MVVWIADGHSGKRGFRTAFVRSSIVGLLATILVVYIGRYVAVNNYLQHRDLGASLSVVIEVSGMDRLVQRHNRKCSGDPLFLDASLL